MILLEFFLAPKKKTAVQLVILFSRLYLHVETLCVEDLVMRLVSVNSFVFKSHEVFRNLYIRTDNNKCIVPCGKVEINREN